MSLRTLLLLSACAIPSLAGIASAAQTTLHRPQIVAAIDENDLVVLRGNTHPAARAANDRGRVHPDLPMTDLILVLSRSREQQAACDAMVEKLYDPASPEYHHWLTPQQIGTEYGPADADIAKISSWLSQHGLVIQEIAPNRMSIRFSGTASQVESAFHTEIHKLMVRGVDHIGNMSDPEIPAALAPAVVGVKSLHNFFARPRHTLGGRVALDRSSGHWRRTSSSPEAVSDAAQSRARPQFATNVPASGSSSAYLEEDVTPYDFATIYNLLPLWNASTPINGSGQTIAIAGTSAIDIGTNVVNGNGNNDVATFRSTFGLPAYSAGQMTQTSGNSQPLTVCTSTDPAALCGISDLTENTLDVEWAGATAKNANIILVASYPASPSDDNLYDSESYIVNNNVAKIMNVSYGQCELQNGTAGNVEYYNLWQTASAQGIAVFVSSGDGGSAECDDGGDAIGNPYSAEFGLSVSGLASTPFDTAVGGTDFNWCSQTATTECTSSTYWRSTNSANGSSALGYIPELPWNDDCTSPLAITLLESWAAFANVSGVTDAETACNFDYNDWSLLYQDTGGSNGGVDLSSYVDTIGAGGGMSACVVSDGLDVASCSAATTTTGSANGSLTLVQDGWPKPSWQTGVAGIPNDGVRDLPDVSFFGSDGFLSNSAYLVCVSELGACTYSTTSEAFAQEIGGTSVPTAAMAGVMALIDQKAGSPQGNPNAELYKLAGEQNYSNCSAETVTASGSCYFNDIDQGSNAVPCDDGAKEGSAAQTGIQSPGCTPKYTDDLIGILPGYAAATGFDLATGLGSMNVANVVNAWPTITGNKSATVTVTPSMTSVNVNSSLSVVVGVASTSGSGATPTGSVSLTGGGYTSSSGALSSGSYTFTIPANSLSVGSDTLTVAYSGDTVYGSANGSATVTVNSGTTTSPVFALSATAPSSVSPGSSGSATLTVSSSTGYSGSISLTCSLTTSPSGAQDQPSCSLANSSVTLSAASTSVPDAISFKTTAAQTGQLQQESLPDPRRRELSGGVFLAFLLFCGIGGHSRRFRSLFLCATLLAVLSSLTACKGFWDPIGSNSSPGTTAGTYTFTISGTGSSASNPVSTTVSLTVN